MGEASLAEADLARLYAPRRDSRMVETLIGLMGEGLFSLVSPLALSRFAHEGHKRRTNDAMAQLRKQGEVRSSLSLAQLLLSAGLTPDQADQVWAFLRSPEGRTLIAFITTVTIGKATLRDEDREALTKQATALLRLYGCTPSIANSEVAAILCGQLSDGAHETLRLIRQINTDLAASIVDHAASEMRNPNSMTARAIYSRTADIDRLNVSPAELYTQVGRYTSGVLAANEQLVVPTVRSDDLRTAHDSLYIERLLVDPTDDADLGEGLLAVLSSSRRVVILGDPGGGKTTEIRNLLLTLARSVSDENIEAVPFLVKLRTYARTGLDAVDQRGNLLEFMMRSAQDDYSSALSLESISYLLHTGRAVVCFDGLDEVLNIEDRLQIVERIQAFAANYPLAHCLVTSRRIGYDSTTLGPQFSRVSLPNLSSDELEKYCKKFFAAIPYRRADSTPEHFLQQTSSVDEIRRNPLMLGVLCSLYLAGRRIPRNRLDLYQDCSEMLFSAWDSRRRLFVELDDELNTEQAVNELALEVFRSQEEEFSRGWARIFLRAFYLANVSDSVVAAERFAKSALEVWQGRRWLIVDAGQRDGEDYLRFSHRTFLEYYAARQQVFECADAKSMYKALEKYIQTRAATVFCALASEIYSNNFKGASDLLLAEALADAQRLQTSGHTDLAYNVLAFCVEGLASFRHATTATKTAIVRELVELLGQLAVPCRVPRPRRRGWEAAGPDWWNVFEGSASMHRSADGRSMDSVSPRTPGMTISEVCDILRSFENLSEHERSQLLGVVIETVRRMCLESGDVGFRLLYVLFFLSASESWMSGVGEEMRGGLRGLIDDKELSSVLDACEPDFWVLMQALAACGYVPRPWLDLLAKKDLSLDVSGGLGGGIYVSLIDIVIVDLLDMDLGEIWGTIHPQRGLINELVVGLLADAKTGGPRAAPSPDELGWPIRRVPLSPRNLSEGDASNLTILMSVIARSPSGSNSFGERVRSSSGSGKVPFLELLEFLKYPIVASDWWEHPEQVFPGLQFSFDVTETLLATLNLG